jgi:hypothetical protein
MLHYPYKICWTISHNMKGASLGLISYKNDLPLKEVVRQYFNIRLVAGFCTTLIRYAVQYLTT